MPHYTVERRNLGGKRAFFRHVVVNPGGIVMGDSFNDIGGEKPAQAFADVLNRVFEEGRLAGALEEQERVAAAKSGGPSNEQA